MLPLTRWIFLDDVATPLTTDDRWPGPGRANNLKTFINTPGWLEEMLDLPEEGGYGPKSLHLEEEAGHPKPGFWLMASVQEDGRDNLPHDHGNAWVVYGVYDGSIEQTKWRWFYPGEGVDRLQLKETGVCADAGAWPSSCLAKFTTPATSRAAAPWWCAWNPRSWTGWSATSTTRMKTP